MNHQSDGMRLKDKRLLALVPDDVREALRPYLEAVTYQLRDSVFEADVPIDRTPLEAFAQIAPAGGWRISASDFREAPAHCRGASGAVVADVPGPHPLGSVVADPGIPFDDAGRAAPHCRHRRSPEGTDAIADGVHVITVAGPTWTSASEAGCALTS